ncbi:MAG: hypothetical protein AB1643_01140 [Patescibacteria group bacterium]
MPKHGTTQAVEGSYVEFQVAVLRALPRDIDADTRLGWTKNGESLSRILREALMPNEIEENKILKLISAGDELVLDAVDGKDIIPCSKDMFKVGIDSDFVNWNANEPGPVTKETQVAVYEMVASATYTQMFSSIRADLNSLCLTQAQIKNFIIRRNFFFYDFAEDTIIH